jgi:hypothetical protein
MVSLCDSILLLRQEVQGVDSQVFCAQDVGVKSRVSSFEFRVSDFGFQIRKHAEQQSNQKVPTLFVCIRDLSSELGSESGIIKRNGTAKPL